MIRISSKAAHAGLKEVIQHLETNEGIIGIAPDGPKGPRYQIKPGVAMIAIKTEIPIMAISWKANRFWEANSWDRLKIPKPFSKIEITIKEPVIFDKDSPADYNKVQQILQDYLASTL